MTTTRTISATPATPATRLTHPTEWANVIEARRLAFAGQPEAANALFLAVVECIGKASANAFNKGISQRGA